MYDAENVAFKFSRLRRHLKVPNYDQFRVKTNRSINVKDDCSTLQSDCFGVVVVAFDI